MMRTDGVRFVPRNHRKKSRSRTMRLIRFFQNLLQKMQSRVAFLDYKIKQRRQLKKQKADDPNIYPMW
jgi:uncharacterized protein YjiS (DUF1127 family)